MSRTVSRRELFRRLSGAGVVRRPPGAVAEARFMELCDGCGRCIDACAGETGVLTADRGGAPVIDFSRGFCTFCAACVRACGTGALRDGAAVEMGERPFAWRMRIDEAGCLEFAGTTCRLCESACEWEAIRFRPLPGFRTRAWIEAEACTGCGECLSRCPQKAIVVVEAGDDPTGENGNRERAA